MARIGCMLKRASLAGIVAVVVISAGGCLLDENGLDSANGTLVLRLSFATLSLQTLEPPLSMEIASFDIQGTGPNPLYDHFADPANTSGLLTQEWLNPGLWTVTVDARNAAGAIIGHGQTDPPVLITAGLVTEAQINIGPLRGPGVLQLTAQWPKGAHSDVSVESALISLSSGVDLAPAFVLSPRKNPQKAAYSNSAIEGGYYLLSLRLYAAGAQFWGITEAVRIVAGQTTSQTWTTN